MSDANTAIQNLAAGADPRDVAVLKLHELLDERGNLDRRLLELKALAERRLKLEDEIDRLREVVAGRAQLKPEPAAAAS